MPTRDYTPRQALDVLVDALRARFPELEQRVRTAIDSGKIVFEEETIGTRRRRRHRFPVRVPLSDEQALEKAIQVLQIHLVEAPRIFSSVNDELSKLPMRSEGAEVVAPRTRLSVEIETQREGTFEKTGSGTAAVSWPSPESLLVLEDLFKSLVNLTSDNNDADSH